MLKLTGVTITAALLVGSTASSVAAAPRSASAIEHVESKRIGSAEIASAVRRSDPSASRAAVAMHVAEQAQQGRLVDSKNVRSAVVGGGQVTWEAGSVVDELRVDRYKLGDQPSDEAGIVELALIGAEESDAPQAQPGGIVGAGMTGSSSLTGGSRLASYCQTWTYNGNSVTGCQEKFKPTNDYSSTRDYYVYNRWGTAQGKQVSYQPDWKVTKFDMRSRPRAGYETRTKGMNDYFPISTSQLCAEGGSVGLGVGSLSFTIGLRNCSEKYPIPNATTKTMGLIYDAGTVFETRTVGVDYEQEVFTWQGAAAPLLGFYNYGKFCQHTYATCSGTLGKNGW